jgi:flagellar biosynthesis/type III secretory pathway M-ring protein FliF/YscJ
MSFTEDVKTASRWLLWGGTALLVAVAAFVVLWQLGWILTEKGTENRDRINEKSYGRQETLKTQVAGYVQAVRDGDVAIAQAGDDQATVDALRGQQRGTASRACREAAKIRDPASLDPGLLDWVRTNCSAGALRPASTYNPQPN